MLLGITFLVFLFIQIAPGDFLDTLKMNPLLSQDSLEIYREKFHLNEPVAVQYVYWLKNLLRGDLGHSFVYKAQVKNIIASRALNTLILSLSSILFTWLFVIPFGVIACRYKNKLPDRVLSFFSYIGISTPSFFLAFVLLFLAMVTGVLPLGGMRAIDYESLSVWGKIINRLKHLIIPTIALSLGSIAALGRIMRANLLEVLGCSYIVAAKARGIKNVRIFYIHALKNALNPMITIFGYQFSSLLSGAALTEIICGWPGLGVVTLKAVTSQDIYLVMGAVLMGGVFLIVGNLLADILLAYSDPRIRYERGN